MRNERNVSPINLIAIRCRQTVRFSDLNEFTLDIALNTCFVWKSDSVIWNSIIQILQLHVVAVGLKVLVVIETIVLFFFLSIQIVRLQIFLPTVVPILLLAFKKFWLFHYHFRQNVLDKCRLVSFDVLWLRFGNGGLCSSVGEALQMTNESKTKDCRNMNKTFSFLFYYFLQVIPFMVTQCN